MNTWVIPILKYCWKDLNKIHILIVMKQKIWQKYWKYILKELQIGLLTNVGEIEYEKF